MQYLLVMFFSIFLIACGNEDENNNKVLNAFELPEVNMKLNIESPEGIWLVSEEASYKYLVKNAENMSNYYIGAEEDNKDISGEGISKQYIVIKKSEGESELILNFCNLDSYNNKYSYTGDDVLWSNGYSDFNSAIKEIRKNTISLNFTDNLNFKGTYSKDFSKFEGGSLGEHELDYYYHTIREGALTGVKLSDETRFSEAKELFLDIRMTDGTNVVEHNDASSNLEVNCYYIEKINTRGMLNNKSFEGEYLNTGAKFRTQDELVDDYFHAVYIKEGMHESTHLAVFASDLYYGEMLYCNPPDQSCRNGVVIEKNDNRNLHLSFGFGEVDGILDGKISLSN